MTEPYDLYPVLLAERELGTGSGVDRATRALEAELEARGLRVVTATTLDDAELEVSSNAGIGAALLDWDLFSSESQLLGLAERIHAVHEDIPVLLLAEKSDVEGISLDVAQETDGSFWLHEDTPGFVAGRVERMVKSYIDSLFSPFFGALKRYVDEYNWVWCCPGHNGGMFYRKTPLGRAFFDHVGEPFLRGDLCNAVPELGSILQHQGPVLDAEKEAAKIFGAERTYFVLNGTSTSNKIVALALLTPGDLVLFDRNCHKSMHHGALMMAGAVPIYLNPTRDAYGIIGPVDHRLLDEASIRRQIQNNPLVADHDAYRRPRPFRLAILTNTTYDGVCYNEHEILARIGHLCEYIIFDEAWMAYARFHPLFVDRFGMSLTDLGPNDPGIYVTQSTHKCLAGMSQASQIHVRDAHLKGQGRRINHDRFNEVFMMHTSTSPQYNMIASLDVGAEVMRGRRGFGLMDEAVRESIALRKQVERYHDEIAGREVGSARAWFFGIFGPRRVTLTTDQLETALEEPYLGQAVRAKISKLIADGGAADVAWRELDDDILASVPECWMFHSGDDWHGLDGLAPGYVMLDPTKCSLITPGITNGRQFDLHGIPAAIPAAVLRAKGIVNEKTSFYTILLLVTPAIERGKSATLLSELLAFKRAYDEGVALQAVLPTLVTAHPERYLEMTLPDLCDQMHDLLRTGKADALQRDVYNAAHEPEIVMPPVEAHTKMLRNQVDLVPLDDLAGRTAACLIVVYPPGIAVMVPGERFAPGSPAIDYLRLFEESDNRFPGFENEMQGIFPRRDDEGRLRYYTYVVRED
jgi:ornithine decarboxylase